MPTTTPDPTQIAAEQKVLAPQTMPEERTNQNVLEAGGCSWRDDVVENGYTWNPRVLPYGEVQCVSCACKVNFLNYLLFDLLGLSALQGCYRYYQVVNFYLSYNNNY